MLYGLELCRYHFGRLLGLQYQLWGRLFRNLFSQNAHFRNKDLLLQIKNTSCCLCSLLWNWWLSALSRCQIQQKFSCFRQIFLFRNAWFTNFGICFL